MRKIYFVMFLISMTLLSCSNNSFTKTSDGMDSLHTNNDVTADTIEDTPQLAFSEEDNGGIEFTILSTEHARYEYDAESQTGEVVNDAVYEKNSAVEDYLGIKFNFVYQLGHWSDRISFNNTISNSVLAGDGEIDLVSGVMVCVMPVSGEGYFMDGNDLPYLDLANPWWVQKMYEKFSINNILYGFIGDASLSMYKDMSVVFFNSSMIESYGLDSPYELVRNNEWVLDKFIEMGLSVSMDLNGDGKIDYQNDLMGCISEAVPNGTFQTALESTLIGYNDNGTPFFTGLTEKYISAYERLHDFYCLNENTYVLSTIDDRSFTTMKTFNEGRVLLMCNFIYSTEHLREMDDDYGIVPYPKYDANQKNYLSQLGTSTSMLFVPITTNDVELTSKVMECLSYFSYNIVSPKYYEVALKEKYSRDEDMKEMLDIIRQGATLDFQFVYGTTIDATPNDFRFTNPSSSTSKDVTSRYASNETKWVTNLENLTSKYIK